MKNFIKILIMLCFAYFVPTITMEQADETTNQPANLAEDILPNELWTMILSKVYCDVNAYDECQNISDVLDVTKEKLSNISKNIRLVCRTFNYLNNSISTSNFLKNELKDFYRSSLILRLPKVLGDRRSREFIEFINTGIDKGIIADVISYYHCYLSSQPIIKIIGLLLLYGAHINTKNKSGNTPMHQAMCLRRNNKELEKVITMLLDYDADVNTKDAGGRTPLYLALESHYYGEMEKVIRTLLDHDANVNIQDQNGDTALHVAIYYYRGELQCLEIIKILLAHQADFILTNSRGNTPLALAEISSYNKLKELFRFADKNSNKPT